MNPLAIKRSLYLSIVPFGRYLILYTHLKPIRDLPADNWVKVQVLLTTKTSISLSMAVLHLGNWTTWLKETSSDGVVVTAMAKDWKVGPRWEYSKQSEMLYGKPKLGLVLTDLQEYSER